MKDPIKFYFMDKMQIVILNFNKRKIKNILTESTKTLNLENKKKNKKIIRIETKNYIGTDLFDLRKATREKKYFFFNKVQKINKNNEHHSIENRIKEHKEKNQRNNDLIKNQLTSQRERFIVKIKQRQEKSLNKIRFSNKSYSKISKFSSFKSNTFSPEVTLTNILREIKKT